MNFVWATAAKDWIRFRRDPVALVLWLGIPLVVGGLMVMMSGGKEGPRPQAHVLVADLDDSFLSGLLVGALSQEEAGGFVRAEKVTEADGRARMEDGDATALLVIPVGFADALLNESPSELELVTNPSQRILPGIVEESLSMFVDATFYLHRMIGDDLRTMAAGPDSGDTFPDAWIADFSVRINHLVDDLRNTVFPPAIEVAFGPETDPAEEVPTAEASVADEPASLALLFVPGLLFMSLLFMSQGFAADLWREREQRTLRRVISSPRTALEFLLGKVLGGAGVMLGVGAVALAAAFLYFDLDWILFPVAVAWATFSGCVLLVMMMLIQMLAASQRAGSILTMTLVFPLMMLGGSFFPFEAMPGWMVAVGSKTPNGWALVHLKEILAGSETAPELGLAFAGLLALTSVLLVLAGMRMSSGFARG
ncbi:MAG: hypothetical protein DHS20C21_06230 [Gemmatimonadota bacterium]|nr:MAG: hypothetical protein DHS20C21_06230 [Gemmatimonadota bacterium]